MKRRIAVLTGILYGGLAAVAFAQDPPPNAAGPDGAPGAASQAPESPGDNAARAAERAREQADRARERVQEETARIQARAAERAARIQENGGPARGANAAYQRGARALDDRDYSQAIEDFRRVIESKSALADGAGYWQAYAQMKLGMLNDAMATLNETLKSFPQSGWLGDVRALQAELQQSLGRGVPPETQPDDELKLLALNSLMRTEPDRALPLLEKILSDPKNSPRLKDRALFVLAGSKDPKARDILMRYAKGGGNPDLQVRAIEYLGMSRTPENQQALAEIYASSSDANVKRAVLRGFLVSRDADRLSGAARTETNPELRKDAIRWLGTIRSDAAAQSLAALYASESDKSVKGEILQSLGIQGVAKPLIDIARKETDPELKRRAVQSISTMKSKEATDFMEELLTK